MSLIPYPHEVKYTDEKGQSLLRNTLKTRRLTGLSPEKIRDFLSKFEGAGDGIVQGLEAMDIRDEESRRRNKYAEQLVRRRILHDATRRLTIPSIATYCKPRAGEARD